MEKFFNNKQIIPLRGKTPLWAGWTQKDLPLAQRYDTGRNYGWVIGQDFLVVDVDPRNGGTASLEALATLVSELNIPTVRTGSGGFHFYFRKPPDFKPRKLSAQHPGIELLHGAKQVVIPPSIHPKTNKFYEFLKPPESSGDIPTSFSKIIEEDWGFVSVSKTNIESGHLFECVNVEDIPEILSWFPATEYSNHDEWAAFILGVHHMVGGNTDAIPYVIDWSQSDPGYEGDPRVEGRIEEIWASARGGGSNVRTLSWFLANSSSRRKNPLRKHLQKEHKKLIVESYREALSSGIVTEAEAANSFKESFKTRTQRQLGEEIFDNWETLNLMDVEKKFTLVDTLLKEFLKDKKDKIVVGDNRTVFTYADNHWSPTPKHTIIYEIQKFIDERNQARYLKQSDDFYNLLIERSPILLFDDFIPSIIPAKNCVLEIDEHTGEITPKLHSHEIRNTYILPYDYDPQAACPSFDTMLQQIWEDLPDTSDMVRHFWELFGYILQPRKDIATILFFEGKGHNGKSTLVSFVEDIVGGNNISKGDARVLGKDKFFKSSIVSKLLFVDDDMASDIRLPSDVLKELSESKVITYERKYEQPTNGHIHLVPMFLTNNGVWVDDSSYGFQRRVQAIPFNNDVSKYGETLPKLARTELSGILNGALLGVRRLRKRGGFDIPESVALATRRLLLNSNPVFLWLQSLQNFTRVKGDDEEQYIDYKAWASFRGYSRHHVDFRKFQEILDDYERMKL